MGGHPRDHHSEHTGTFRGTSQLALLRVVTDQGLEGHAFLGSSMSSADQDGSSLIKNLQPLLLGRTARSRALPRPHLDQALRVGRAIEALGFYWYEDPLADDDLYGCIRLREKLDIPLMATEYAPGGITSCVPWIINRATDYLRGDVAVKGGVTALIKIAHLAEAFGMNFEVHHGGTRPSTSRTCT